MIKLFLHRKRYNYKYIFNIIKLNQEIDSIKRIRKDVIKIMIKKCVTYYSLIFDIRYFKFIKLIMQYNLGNKTT